MWRNDWERLGPLGDTLADGVQVIAAGGCDYYPGSASASPSFSFSVSTLRVAGEGDLLAQIERAPARARRRRPARSPARAAAGAAAAHDRRRLRRERQGARGPRSPALARRGWAGRVVWAFTPVQDRHAAPRIGAALRDLAASGEVEAIVVARGGGSPTDLLAFSDELLCRTVALLAVPVIASIGHHTDRTLLDEVAAASCSTPTHAAEEAVPLNCLEARVGLPRRSRGGCATTPATA